MKPKQKLILEYPIIGLRNALARRLAKKAKKDSKNHEMDKQAGRNTALRYSDQFKNDYVLKKAKKILKFLNVKVEVEGLENVPNSTALLAPNHSSLIDPLLILIALENPGKSLEDINKMPVFIAKKSLSKNRRFKGYLNLLNTFYIDRKNPRAALETIDKMVVHAKETHKQIVIFPEGTRSKDGSLGDFKGGTFRIAKKSFLPVVPVTINNALSAVDLDRKKTLHVKVIFHPVIKPMEFMVGDTKSTAERVKKIVESKLTKPEGSRSKKENIV